MTRMSASPKDKLSVLRQAMRANGIAACLVPTADPHLSEYLPGHWSAREWLSGFTGSAGTLLITADHAGLWTDSRYFSQAEQQLADSGIALMKQKVAHAPEHLTWLQQQLHRGDVVAVAGDSLSVTGQRQIARLLDEVEGNLARGYAWEERVVERTEWRPCRDIVGVKDGRPIVVTRSCWRDVADTERYRVPIDPAAETRKRDNLRARLAALQPGAEAAIRACRAAYPEEAAASPAR